VALSHGRVVAVGETLYPHEQEGIEFAIQALPDTDPYHLWALIDLLDKSTGRYLEIDLLILGYSCLYLVELKAWPGRIEGDSIDWTWTTPEGRTQWKENPLRLTRRKAQILKSRLERSLPAGTRAPWIEPLVFLSHQDVKLGLTPDGILNVVRRDDFAAAITRHEFRGADPRLQGQRVGADVKREVVRALGTLGFRQRKGKLLVGPYQLGELLDETDKYQDRVATHLDLKVGKKPLTRRARTYLVGEQTSIERRQQLRRAADREAQLLYEVSQHPNILTYAEYITDAPLGPTVLLEDFDRGVPLDTFIRQHPTLSFEDRIALIEQIGRAVDHCHKKGVVHGGLCPSAVLVRPGVSAGAAPESRLFNFQLGKGEAVTATSHASDLAAETWWLYQSREALQDPEQRNAMADIFALGAVAFFILTSRPPAVSLLERQKILETRRCLDPRAIDDDVPEAVADLVAMATHEVIAQRADDAGQWIELLLNEITKPVAERPPETSPLEARPGDMVGSYLVEGVLGHGASARVLQVTDDAGHTYALKVSLGPDHDGRLDTEAAVLEQLAHPRIVRFVAKHTIADRTCLVLSLAGERTLYKELADQGTISLDYAARWGEDLLSALEHLEENEIVHRDIKPANIGVGNVSKKARTLYLYDFSLAASPMSEVRVGTAAYRDPFLPERRVWDHAADRYSAAVTLHEIVTGVRPTHGENGTIAIAAERFDPAVRAGLVGFFQRALQRNALERHEDAAAMRHAWLAAFATSAAGRAPVVDAAEAEPELAPLTDDQIRAIDPDTAIAALPLSTRARNALDRAGLLVAQDLLSLPENRLSAIRGVGQGVAKEIHELRTRWQALRPLDAERGAALFPGYQGDDLHASVAGIREADVALLADAGLHTLAQIAAAPARHVEALGQKHGIAVDALRTCLAEENRRAGERHRPTTLEGWLDALFPAKRKREQQVRAVFGLEGPFAGKLDASPAQVAKALGVAAPYVYQSMGKAGAEWAKHEAVPSLAERVRREVAAQGGAIPLAACADWLASELPHDPALAPDRVRVCAAAVLRAIAEVDKDLTTGLRFVRLADDRSWLVSTMELTSDLRALGARADALAARDVLAGPDEVDRTLREALTDGSPLATLAADRLVRLAAAASDGAAASPRLELYPRGMSAARALKLSAAALGSGLGAIDLVGRVSARYPDAEPLPPRPALDGLVETLGLSFDPKNNQYTRGGERNVSSIHTRSASLTRVSQLTPQSLSERDVEIGDFEDRLRACVERKGLLVLGVATDLADEAAEALTRRFGLTRESFDRRFIVALDRRIAADEIDPEVVVETDANGHLDDGWRNLRALAAEAAGDVTSILFPPRSPLLVTEPGLIDRYQLDGFLRSIVAAARDDASAAIIMLCPGHGGGQPTIEGRTIVPGVLPGQSMWIPPSWIIEHRRRAA
jgi:serine/threonine protein kinase